MDIIIAIEELPSQSVYMYSTTGDEMMLLQWWPGPGVGLLEASYSKYDA
jgi:hypothetical protein